MITFNIRVDTWDAYLLIDNLETEKTRLEELYKEIGEPVPNRVKELQRLINKIHASTKGRKFYGNE